MQTSDITQELTKIEIWSGFMQDPPIPYLALQLTVTTDSGETQVLPWMAVAPALAQRMIEAMQTSLGSPPSAPAQGAIH